MGCLVFLMFFEIVCFSPKSKMKMKLEPTRRSLRNIGKATGNIQLPITFTPTPVTPTPMTQQFAVSMK